MIKHIERINTAIKFLFYAFFLSVPLAMNPRTHELFEFNKMWLVFGFSSIIFFLWGTKMILQRKIEIKRTPFDIAIILFLISQTISTIFSIDSHTSFWGYYSRFNGGLLSTISYIFLYYAFATNILTSDKKESIKQVTRMILVVVASGVIVSLWGIPSHFGKDPTCLVFRGSLDDACWTEAFKPQIRMFSTLGQPNWLAAFLAILTPIASAFAILSARRIKDIKFPKLLSTKAFATTGMFGFFAFIFYLCIGWTLSQSGFLGFWGGYIIFTILIIVFYIRKFSLDLKTLLNQKAFTLTLVFPVIFLLTTFFTTSPIPALQPYLYKGLTEKINISTIPQEENTQENETPLQPALENNITDSGNIRLIVWQGAVDVFKENPIFGSGVETFAYAYYKHRPIEHNLTSEWDFLYNKAHNEFLNYLATSGLFGLTTYLLIIIFFLFYSTKTFYQNYRKKLVGNPLLYAFFASFLAIQISNFFGFSVVVVNLMFFFIPLFFYAFTQNDEKYIDLSFGDNSNTQTPGQTFGIVVLGALSIYMLYFLFNAWRADVAYAMGYNLQRVNDVVQANPFLEEAVRLRSGEDLFKNEYAVNLSTIALLYAQQNDSTAAGQIATEAKRLSDGVEAKNPNNVVFYKSRTRVLFSLAQLNPVFLNDALDAIEKAEKLAPTDAKVKYNKALLYDQGGKTEEAIQILDETISIKPNYRDAYYARALLRIQLSEKDSSQKDILIEKAKDDLNYIINNLAPNDTQSVELLKTIE